MDLPDVCPFISHHGKTPCIQQQGTQSCLLLIATKKLDAGCACQAKIDLEGTVSLRINCLGPNAASPCQLPHWFRNSIA